MVVTMLFYSLSLYSSSLRSQSNMVTCSRCRKSVYQMDPQINLDGILFHKSCAKCETCNCQITLTNFVKCGNSLHQGKDNFVLLCKNHYSQRLLLEGGHAENDKFKKKTERLEKEPEVVSNASETPCPTTVVDTYVATLIQPETIDFSATTTGNSVTHNTSLDPTQNNDEFSSSPPENLSSSPNHTLSPEIVEDMDGIPPPPPPPPPSVPFISLSSKGLSWYPEISAAPSNQDKFKRLGGALGPTCASCNKTVYRIEEINACGVIWHKSCFLCGGAAIAVIKNAIGCRKQLTQDTYHAHEKCPYCRRCVDIAKNASLQAFVNIPLSSRNNTSATSGTPVVKPDSLQVSGADAVAVAWSPRYPANAVHPAIGSSKKRLKSVGTPLHRLKEESDTNEVVDIHYDAEALATQQQQLEEERAMHELEEAAQLEALQARLEQEEEKERKRQAQLLSIRIAEERKLEADDEARAMREAIAALEAAANEAKEKEEEEAAARIASVERARAELREWQEQNRLKGLARAEWLRQREDSLKGDPEEQLRAELIAWELQVEVENALAKQREQEEQDKAAAASLAANAESGNGTRQVDSLLQANSQANNENTRSPDIHTFDDIPPSSTATKERSHEALDSLSTSPPTTELQLLDQPILKLENEPTQFPRPLTIAPPRNKGTEAAADPRVSLKATYPDPNSEDICRSQSNQTKVKKSSGFLRFGFGTKSTYTDQTNTNQLNPSPNQPTDNQQTEVSENNRSCDTQRNGVFTRILGAFSR